MYIWTRCYVFFKLPGTGQIGLAVGHGGETSWVLEDSDDDINSDIIILQENNKKPSGELSKPEPEIGMVFILHVL